jgi:RND family efflux transporter MFP subunit
MATPPSNTNSSDALASLRINRGVEKSSGRWWKVLLTIIVLGAAGWFVWQNYGDKASSVLGDNQNFLADALQKKEEVRLAAVKVKKGRAADAVVVATGYLGSQRQARIGARAAGRINIVLFEEGKKVTKDQLLAELDHKDLDASLAAASASVARSKASLAEQSIMIEQAKVDWQRTQRLRKSRSVSESEYDQSRFAYKSARAKYDSMKADIELSEAQRRQTEQLRENMFIRAPFDGTVISKDAEVGESIMPGGMGGGSGRGSVATIADLDNLEIECDVQEDFISRVSVAQEAEISVDAVPDKKYHGKVRMIIPMGDRARATIKVKVAIEDADDLLFPEMSGTVFFLPTDKENEANDEPRIFALSTAVVTDADGNSIVWVVDSEKRAQSIKVEIGEEKDSETEIVSGLEGKERVIVRPPEELRDGTLVKVSS